MLKLWKLAVFNWQKGKYRIGDAATVMNEWSWVVSWMVTAYDFKVKLYASHHDRCHNSENSMWVRATKALDIPWCLDSQSHHLFCFDFHQTNLTKNSSSTPNEMMICSSQESSLLYESAVVDYTENIWTEQTKCYLIWWHLAHTSAHIHSLSSISYIHSFTFLLISSYLSTICLKMNGICHSRQQSKNDPI